MAENIFFEQVLDYIILTIEIVAVIFISGIVVYFLFTFSRIALSRIRRRKAPIDLHELIFRFLRGLLISLDFVIAADILKTIFSRSIEELFTLAIVVAIRILLSWSLSKDFEFYGKKDKENGKIAL